MTVFIDPDLADQMLREYESGIQDKEAEGHTWTDAGRLEWARAVADAYDLPYDHLKRMIADN